MRPPRLAWSAVALAALPLLHGAAELDARSLFEPAFGRGAAPPRHALAEAAAPLAGARYVGVWSMAGSRLQALQDHPEYSYHRQKTILIDIHLHLIG